MPTHLPEGDEDSLGKEETPEQQVEQRRYRVKQNRRPPVRLNNQYEHFESSIP